MPRCASALEREGEQGSSYVLSKLLTRHSAFRTEVQVNETLHSLTATIVPSFLRDFAVLTAGFKSENALPTFELLAELLLHPGAISQSDVEQCKEIARYELQQQQLNQPEALLLELLYQSAFPDAAGFGNGLPRVAEHLSALKASAVLRFLKGCTESLVVAGIGLERRTLEEIVQKTLPRSSSSSRESLDGTGPPFVSAFSQIGCEPLPQERLLPSFTRLAIGWRCEGFGHPLNAPLAVAVSLLGGGSSFSSGGPGKGMYSRLYQKVLNQHHWCESSRAVLQTFGSVGVCCVHGACTPGHASRLLSALVDQLQSLRSKSSLGYEEVERAKARAKSELLMSMEARVQQMEYLGRSSVSPYAYDLETLCSRIDAVDADAISKSADRLLGSAPSMVLWGSQLEKEPADIRNLSIRDFHRSIA